MDKYECLYASIFVLGDKNFGLGPIDISVWGRSIFWFGGDRYFILGPIDISVWGTIDISVWGTIEISVWGAIDILIFRFRGRLIF